MRRRPDRSQEHLSGLTRDVNAVKTSSMREDLVLTVDGSLTDEALNALFAAAWRSHRQRDFAPVLARSLVHVSATIRDRLVGFVNVATDGDEHAFLLDPTVHPAFQRRGIGLALVRRAIAEARCRGPRWLHVDYEAELEPFYRAAGFEATRAGLVRLDVG
jgi:ribosomal protein S18 acetylase RimI-like enzyme